MNRCFRGVLSSTALAFVLMTSAAQAAETVTVSFGADPTEEVPLPVTVGWASTLSSVNVYVTVKPAGGLACAPNYPADEPNSSDVLVVYGGGSAGSRSTNREFPDPGSYVVCGYMQSGSDTVAATGPIILTVRPAMAMVALSSPARVAPGQTFAMVATVNAELRRQLFVTVKPAGGRGCEPNYAADAPVSSDEITYKDVQGAVSVTQNIVAAPTRGNYLLCAWVQEFASDTAPEAVASTLFAVGPDPCTSARSALASAKRKLRSAEASLKRNRAAITRYVNAARRGSQSARRRNRGKAAAARKRYHAAQVRRVNARKSITRRTAAVKAVCR